MDRLHVAETCRQNARLLRARGDAGGARRWYRRAAEAEREAQELTAPHSDGTERTDTAGGAS